MKSITKIFLLLLSIIIIGIMSIITFYYGYYLEDYYELPITFNIVETGIGILKNDSLLHFGHIPLGGGAKRFVNITTTETLHLIIRTEIMGPDGTMEQFMYIEPNDFYTTPNKTHVITFNARPPENASVGQYDGVAKVYLYK